MMMTPAPSDQDGWDALAAFADLHADEPSTAEAVRLLSDFLHTRGKHPYAVAPALLELFKLKHPAGARLLDVDERFTLLRTFAVSHGAPAARAAMNVCGAACDRRPHERERSDRVQPRPSRHRGLRARPRARAGPPGDGCADAVVR
jgi:hypothetical protein